MKLKHLLAALAFCAAGGASAAVLQFDGLTEMVYGDTEPLGAGMRYEGLSLAYVEAGFQLALHTPFAAAGLAHIGDGSYQPQTFNWHDGFENGEGSYVSLTRVGGGLFDLSAFDYFTDASAVWADGNLLGVLEGESTWSLALSGIRELRFVSGAYNQLDNIQVEEAAALPLPGTLSLMLGGLALAAQRRRMGRGA